MTEYHKIQSIFKREVRGERRLIAYQWTLPEFEYLANNEWVFTEKVDGTNIRVVIDPSREALQRVTFKGRTDAASIPATLLERLQGRFLPQSDRLCANFPDGAVLYGEGYGAKIQKGGGNYRQDQDFVLFDVNVCGWWLVREQVKAIGEIFGLDVVPIIGMGTLYSAMMIVEDGFKSTWGDFIAEGIVARPAVELKTRAGNRIITKVKHVDFPLANSASGGV